MTAVPTDSAQTVTPYFTVEDAGQFIGFVTAILGGTVIKDDRTAAGRVQHARIRIGGSVIMLNEASDSYPANISQMHVYVTDTDATYAAALKAGAQSLMEPNERPHGDRMAGITDPSGNTWWLATARS